MAWLNYLRSYFNYDLKNEDIDALFKKLKRLYLINSSNIKEKDDPKFLNQIEEIPKLKQKLKYFTQRKNREYKLLSNKNGILTWGHPDTPDDETKQITYHYQKDGTYTIISSPNANAHIIVEDSLIDINRGKQVYNGNQNQFTLNLKEQSEVLFEESRIRFDSYFQDSDVTITKPFFLDDSQKNLINKLGSSDNKTKDNALRDLLSIAEKNGNCFVPTYYRLPYYDKEGNIIFGFDDDRSSERKFSEAGSKYSLAYKIDSKNSNKIEVIASEKTCDCYVLALDKSDPNNITTELLKIGNNSKNHKLVTSNNQDPKIIDYDLAKNKNCPSLCAVIRTLSGNPGKYGINIYNRIQAFLKNVEAYMLIKDCNEERVSYVIQALNKAINFKQGDTILKIFSNRKNIEDFLKKIKSIIDLSQDFNKEELFFTKLVESFRNCERFEDKKSSPTKLDRSSSNKSHPKWSDLIKYDRSKYDILCSFSDSNCLDENFNKCNSEVFLFCQKNKEFDLKNKKLANSFIVEIEKAEDRQIKAIRVKLGTENEINNLNSYIEFKNEKLLISNTKIEFDKNSAFFEKSSSDEYMCESCLINYEEQNKEILLNTNAKGRG